MKILLEYVWIDAYQNLRSKIKILNSEKNSLELDNIPEWNYDGSSTGQAEGHESDIIIKPVRLFTNPFHNVYYKGIGLGYLVLCQTFDKDNQIHPTNNRVDCVEMHEKCNEYDFWFGMEQEYIIVDKSGLPYKWERPDRLFNSDSYCSAGGDRCYGREISEEHLHKCLEAGISICGTNAEVMTSQWEYQIGAVDSLEVSDHLWMSRYIMNRVTEKYDCSVTFLPKPFADYAGSGLHTNVSTKEMREEGGLEHIYKACEKLRLTHKKHIDLYGEGNNNRLTGRNETCSYEEYKYGVRNRGCSVRIPLSVYNDKKGYLEDRRPGSNADPYVITSLLMESIVFQEL